MNRRNRHIIVVCIAVVTAGLASLGVYHTVKRMPVREVEVARRFVVVAAKSLPTGIRLTSGDVKLVAWPATSPVPASFSSVDRVTNRALLASMVENEPLTETKLASLDAGAGLPPAIPPGMRAMSVRVNDVIGVAGFVVPGTHVDLMVTIRRRDDILSRTVVSNVEVLTAGTRQDQEKPKDIKAAAAASSVVTLLVTPQDAERIALAQAEGQVMLVLRNPLDSQPTMTAGIRSAALLGQEEPLVLKPVVKPVSSRKAVATQPAPSAPPRNYTVEAIRAAKRSEEVVR